MKQYFYDLATLVDNPTQLPRHYRRMSLYLSQKIQPNIFVPISARTEFLSGKAYTNVTTVPSQICPSSNLDQCYMLLLACSRILEHFNAFSSSSLETGIEIRLCLFLRILAVEVVVSEEP